jgi:subtilisin family serine protease
MPKAAIFFAIILFSSAFSNSYGFTNGDIIEDNFVQKNYDTFFDSGIVDVSSDFFTQNNYKRYVVFGAGTNDFDFLKKNSLYGMESERGFFQVAVLDENSVSNLISRGYYVIEDFKLDFHSQEDFPDASRIGEITGSDFAETKYNVTGNGIKIAIVDTGVDFSNPDIQDSLARDKFNHPIMIDPDGQGIILTNATFFAFVDNDNIIRNYSKPIPEGITSGVYQNKEGIFLNILQGGEGTQVPVYNSFFPQAGSNIIFNGTLTNDMKIVSQDKLEFK